MKNDRSEGPAILPGIHFYGLLRCEKGRVMHRVNLELELVTSCIETTAEA
jgi:hypothetical protein